MEIKGEEFLKKVKIKQEKEELEEKLSELRLQEEELPQNNNINSHDVNSNETFEDNIDLNISNQAQQAYENIMIEEPIEKLDNPDKKKNYLILGLVLIVLFLITILTFRFLSSDDEEKKDTFIEKPKQELNAVDTNFQKIMNERKKREEEIKQSTLKEVTPKISEDNTNINPMSDEALDNTIKKVQEAKTEQLSETQKIIKEIEKKQFQPEPKVEVKPEPKKVEKTKEVKSIVKNIENSTPKGYFIQIGAFTKKPSSNYMNNIKKARLKYKIYSVRVNGTLYNKVLIGPYSSRAQAKQNINSVKEKLNISSAFVLKF